MTGGPYDLRPAYTGEDVEIVATVGGTGPLVGWTVDAVVRRPDGTQLSAGVTCEVTDAEAREVTLTVALPDVDGRYRWSIRRTDSGAATVVAWGDLVTTDEEE